ncbi:MAG: hypothetical protein DI537_41100 [Stutzerimonas stutzeri]|nr:MAG: hypothetical protein DI537_41100 [Stutzerimonas stutzeri]
MFKRFAQWLFPLPPEFVIHGLTLNGEEQVMLKIRSKDFMTEAAIRERLAITDQFQVTRVEMNP